MRCFKLVALFLSLTVSCAPSNTTPSDTTEDTPSYGMPANQFPDAAPSFPAPSITEVPIVMPPANLDPLDAAQLNTDVEALLQNGIEASRLMLFAGGSVRRRVSSTDGTNINVKALGAALVKSASIRWKTMPKTTDFGAFAPGGLAASTRYWLYCYDNAGTLTLEHSTTGPDASLAYKSGDESRMYVSTFITNDAAAIVPYSQDDRLFSYSVFTNPTITGNLILWQGAAVVATTKAFGYAVPTQAVGQVDLRVRSSTGVTETLQIAIVGGIGAGSDEWTQVISSANPVVYPLPWSTNRGFSLDYTNNDASARTDIWIERFSL